MVREEKVKEVGRLLELMRSYPTFGLLDLSGMPSKQLQEIKKRLRGKALITVTKKSMLKLAIQNLENGGLERLKELIPLQPAAVFTELDPLKFYLLVTSTKSLAFAKEGDIAKKTIQIKAGPTNLTPGPVIGELAKVQIPVGVEGGKIVIKKDVVAARAGDVISKELASVLRKLKIATKEIGLNVVALYGEKKIYGKDVLELIGEATLKLLKEAFGKALNLSIAINYPTKQNIAYLLAKAWREARFIESRVGG